MSTIHIWLKAVTFKYSFTLFKILINHVFVIQASLTAENNKMTQSMERLALLEKKVVEIENAKINLERQCQLLIDEVRACRILT